jgi:uncharacterized damage-inducible protein DinB
MNGIQKTSTPENTMLSPQYARTFARYNEWMNARLYEAAATLDDADRRKDVGAFFKSIHGTLNHLLLADRVWMGRFTDAAFAVESLAQELYADFEVLRRERLATDAAINRWAEGLTAETLASNLAYVSISKPQPRTIPMAFAVAHFFNHQTHHRGQLTTLLMQRGIDPGVTDLMWLPAPPV